MTKTENIKRTKKPRVPLYDHDLRYLAERLGGESIPKLARRTGLPYWLVYNVARGRVKSVSDRHYRMLFGKLPPPQVTMKVDGGAFRKMVRLWLFLNDDLTKRKPFPNQNPVIRYISTSEKNFCFCANTQRKAFVIILGEVCGHMMNTDTMTMASQVSILMARMLGRAGDNQSCMN